jgi:glutamyl-tRNA reductase
MDNIAIIHNCGNPLSDTLSGIPHLAWKTCLREIIFLNRHEVSRLPPVDTVYTDEAAYSEMLEVICGLQSPVLGETQVFGQFKNFMKESSDAECGLLKSHRSFFTSLTTDAKALREEYRGLLSSAGYGSITRKLIKDCERVAILGSGELSSEIFSLLRETKKCTVFTRNISKDFFGQKLKSLDDLHGDFDSVVLAAPVNNSLMKPFLNGTTAWRTIVDWRAESSLFPEPQHIQYYPISSLFQIVEQEKRLSLTTAEQIRMKIRERAQQFCERVNIRPLGWDDVCA